MRESTLAGEGQREWKGGERERERERERESERLHSMSGGRAERGREGIPSRLCAVSAQSPTQGSVS